MKLLNNYNEYILDMISESFNNDESILVLSKELLLLLGDINNPISNYIMSKSYLWSQDKFKITLLDIDNESSSLDSISFVQTNKAYEIAAEETDLPLKRGEKLTSQQHLVYNEFLMKKAKFDKKHRSFTSLGRIINKLFPNKFSNTEIEEFVNLYKSLREEPVFDIVTGEDIKYWYDGDNYSDGDGSLNNSCMRYEECKSFLDFYSKNSEKVSLLILKNKEDDDLIKGRALIWKLDLPEGRIFMDRIYTTIDYLENHFKNYAKKHKWLYKENQDMYEDTKICDTIDNSCKDVEICVDNIEDSKEYPYLDTLKFYYKNTLSNNKYSENYKRLSNTDGSAIIVGENLVWSDFYNKKINTESEDYEYCELFEEYRFYNDCFWSDYYGSYIPNDYIGNQMIECDYYKRSDDKWRLVGDTVLMYNGKVSTLDYAQKKGTSYSDEFNGSVFNGVWSRYYNSYLPDEKSISIITVPIYKGYYTEHEKDYRIKDDNTYYVYNNELYDIKIKKEDIKNENGKPI